MMNRKADLSLSITAIVVIVIAFVVLGLGLSLTKLIFKGATDKLPEAFAVTQLDAEPTSENPITIPQTVDIDRAKSKTMNIGIYNKNSAAAYGKFSILSCLAKDPAIQAQVDGLIPAIASITQKVGASESAGYSLVVTEKGLPADTYICTIGVICDATFTGTGATCDPTRRA